MKHYIKPQTTVVKLQMHSALLQASSSVKQFNSDEFEFGGGSYIDARTREVFSEDEW